MSADEKLCNNCGQCCYKKIIVGRTVFITPFPCEFLDVNTNLCTIYDKRHELNPLCLSVEDGLKVSAFPADCPYVENHAPPKYRPARSEWNWAEEWDDFDELADELEVSPEMREKVRARGPYAAPMHEEVYARIKKTREEAAGVNAMIWGKEPAAIIDLRSNGDQNSANTPSIAAMVKSAPARSSHLGRRTKGPQ